MEDNKFWLRLWAAILVAAIVLAVLLFAYFTSAEGCMSDCRYAAQHLPAHGRTLTEPEFKLCLEKCRPAQPAQK